MARTKKNRKVLKMVTGIFLVVIFAYVGSLLWLYTSVSHYKDFWQKKAKENGELTYLALGDSAAQGIGATSPMRGYVGLIAKRLENRTGKTVKIVNASKTGATMSDYLNEQAELVSTVDYDLVTIEIGANDIKTFTPERFRSDFKKVLSTLSDGAYVSNMPLFNSRPTSTSKGKQASSIIEEEMKNYSELHFVDLQKYTTENQSIFGFAPDLFHPNNLSYKNWANAFWDQIDKKEQDELFS